MYEINNGFAPIFRKIIYSDVWVNPELLKVWVWCLIRMNHESCKVNLKIGKGFKVVRLKAGQFIFGREKASNELQMPASSVRNRMDKLKEMGMVDSNSDSQYSIITVCNWDKYKNWIEEKGQPKDRLRTAKGQAKDTEETLKTIKTIKNKSNACFFEFWNQYPLKADKTRALKTFEKVVDIEKDILSLNQALNNYLKHLKLNSWKKPRNCSTWLNNWKDWIEYIEGGNNGTNRRSAKEDERIYQEYLAAEEKREAEERKRRAGT